MDILRTNQKVYLLNNNSWELLDVRDCRVRRSNQSKITEVSFTVPEYSNSFNDIQTEKEIKVEYIFDDIVIETEYAIIKKIEALNTKTNVRLIDVEAKGFEVLLTRKRILKTFENKEASHIISEVISEVDGLSVNDIESCNTIINLESIYNTVFEIVEQVAESVGYAWNIKDKQFNFFDPNNNIGENIDNLKIEADSVNYQIDTNNIANVFLVQCYEFKDQNIAQYKAKGVEIIGETEEGKEVRGECISGFADSKIPNKNDYEVYGQPYVYRPSRYYDDIEPKNWVEATIDQDDKRVELDEICELEKDEILKVRYNLRKPFWIERRDESSISNYGERYGSPSPDNNINIEEATNKAENLLSIYSQPQIFLDLNVFKIGYDLNQKVNFNYPSLNIDDDFFITDIDKSFVNGSLYCILSLASENSRNAKLDIIKTITSSIQRNNTSTSRSGSSRYNNTKDDGIISGHITINNNFSLTHDLEVRDINSLDISSKIPLIKSRTNANSVLIPRHSNIKADIPLQKAKIYDEYTAKREASSFESIPLQRSFFESLSVANRESSYDAVIPIQSFKAVEFNYAKKDLEYSSTIPFQNVKIFDYSGAKRDLDIGSNIPRQRSKTNIKNLHPARTANVSNTIPFQNVSVIDYNVLKRDVALSITIPFQNFNSDSEIDLISRRLHHSSNIPIQSFESNLLYNWRKANKSSNIPSQEFNILTVGVREININATIPVQKADIEIYGINANIDSYIPMQTFSSLAVGIKELTISSYIPMQTAALSNIETTDKINIWTLLLKRDLFIVNNFTNYKIPPFK